jgi:hypothetical protein
VPFKSQAQRRFMYAAEARGDVPEGTAKHFEDATPKGKKLPKAKAEEGRPEVGEQARGIRPGMSDKVSIAGLSKAEVLAALVNATTPLGMGILQDDGRPLTAEQAQRDWIDAVKSHDTVNVVKQKLYFDYVKGRSIKCDISGDEFDPRWYDRDAGVGAAARVIAKLREVV